MRKSLTLAFVILLALTPQATAAPKPLVLKPITVIGDAMGAESALISGKTIITYENIEGTSLDIKVMGRDLSGKVLWNTVIESGSDEIATAATLDSQGNIWIAGASSHAAIVETTTVIENPINIDGVVVETQSATRGDLNTLNVWQITPLGETKTYLSLAMDSPLLVNGISSSASGISLIATSEAGSVLISAKSDGSFTKPITIGTSKTSLQLIHRNSDGSAHIFGSSSETLGGKKAVGAQDGVLIKASPVGKIISVVRSSAPKALRKWTSATSTNFLAGTVVGSSTSEIAITKFNATFAPTWTMRIPGVGNPIGINAGSGTFFVALQPKALAAVPKWRPGKDQSAILSLSAKGLITAAYSAPELGAVISASYSKEAGVILLAQKRGTSEVSIFYLNSK